MQWKIGQPPSVLCAPSLDPSVMDSFVVTVGGGAETCDWPWTWKPTPPAMQTTHHHYHFTPNPTPIPTKLSDGDVDRIARRLAVLLREPKP